MSLLALPGRKPETLTWMRALLHDLGEPDALVQCYGFWCDPDTPNPDIAREIALVAASGATRVLAKSIGALIAMRARRDTDFAARSYVFVGAPVKRLQALGWPDLLAQQALAAQTLFIQQTGDPTGTFAELSAARPANATRREVPGADHAYTDTRALAALADMVVSRTH